MSGASTDRDEAALQGAIHAALSARDRTTRVPRFAQLWPAGRTSHPVGLRPALAACAIVALLAGLSWVALRREASVPQAELQATAQLARELSSPDYWRVPTDDLLAFAAPPLSADLPAPEGFDFSLEESLL
jgi:hypothetical protein